ncbi:MAG: hypothetical protein FWC81_03660 [Coriobacteriia bacterium]|nr:hypothetical protein [Coriobacteriia bacterium]
MSDDLFYEDEPVEAQKKPVSKKKASPEKTSGTAQRKGAPAKKGAPARKAAPAKQVPANSGFEFTSVVVALIAVIALLIGFLAGMLVANVFLTPSVSPGPANMQQQPGGGMGGMGMGGGMGDAPILSDEEMMQDMPDGHPPVDAMGMGDDGMPGMTDNGAADEDVADDDGASADY